MSESASTIAVRQSKKVTLRHANILNRAREDLTRDQRRILYLVLRTIQLDGWPENDLFRFNRKDWANWFGVSESEAGRDMKNAINGYRGKYIVIYDELDGTQYKIEMDWVSSRWSNDERGMYAIRYNPDLKKYLTPVASELTFTVTEFEQVCNITAKWAQRLYNELSQFRETGKVYINLDQLRERWCLPASYEKWGLLRTRVLEPAMEEVKRFREFADLEMVTKTEGNKVTHIMFLFSPRE